MFWCSSPCSASSDAGCSLQHAQADMFLEHVVSAFVIICFFFPLFSFLVRSCSTTHRLPLLQFHSIQSAVRSGSCLVSAVVALSFLFLTLVWFSLGHLFWLSVLNFRNQDVFRNHSSVDWRLFVFHRRSTWYFSLERTASCILLNNSKTVTADECAKPCTVWSFSA